MPPAAVGARQDRGGRRRRGHQEARRASPGAASRAEALGERHARQEPFQLLIVPSIVTRSLPTAAARHGIATRGAAEEASRRRGEGHI
jgi:hypothetical protein